MPTSITLRVGPSTRSLAADSVVHVHGSALGLRIRPRKARSSQCLVNTHWLLGAVAACGRPVTVADAPWADSVVTCRNLKKERALVKVHVLQVDRNPANIAELEDGIAAGRTVDDWQMPKGAKPGDLVIWYAAGQQRYISPGMGGCHPRGG
jgi:hypothetical protein